MDVLWAYARALGPLAGGTLLIPPLSGSVPAYCLPISKSTLLQSVAFSHTSWQARRWWVAWTYPLVHQTSEQLQNNLIALLLCSFSPMQLLGAQHFYACYLLGGFAGVGREVFKEQGMLQQLMGRFLEWGAAPYVVGAEASVQAIMGVQTCIVLQRVYNLFRGSWTDSVALYDICALLTIGTYIPSLASTRDGLFDGYLAGVLYYILFTRQHRTLYRYLTRGLSSALRRLLGRGPGRGPESGRPSPPGWEDLEQRRIAAALAAEQRNTRRPGR